MKSLMTLLRSWGIRIIIDIDDMFILAGTKEEAAQHLEVLLFLLEALGFMVNLEKSHTNSAQEIKFLGLTVYSQTMHSLQLRLPGKKIRQICKEAAQLQAKELVSARQLSQLLGKLSAASHAMWVAPLFYRLRFSKEFQDEFDWWQSHLSQWNGKVVIQRQAQIVIQSDTSLAGWGAVCKEVSTGGSWIPQEQTVHINWLELLAADLAVRTFLKDHHRVLVLLQLENSTAVAYMNNLGGTVSPALPMQ